MKKLFILSTVLFLAALTVSCKEEPKPTPEPSDNLCQIVSFGFNAEDNDFNADYKAIIKNRNIMIYMPAALDRSSLIAAFEVTEDDEVTIGDEIVESGVTAIDYSSTVSIMVSDSKSALSAQYTVRIYKLDKTVTALGNLVKSDYKIRTSGFKCKLNPNNNLPYLVYSVDYLEEDLSTKTRLGAARWNGTAFERLGSEGFSEISAGAVDIAFDSKGKPYVMFCDKGVTEGLDDTNRPTVMSYANGIWTVVGRPRISSETSQTGETLRNCLAIDAGDYPVVIATDNDKSGSFYRAPELCYYNGSSWTNAIPMPGRPAVDGTSYATYKALAVLSHGYVYIVTANNGVTGTVPNGNSVYKYANGNVSTVLEGSFIDASSSATSAQDISIDIASDGTIYVLSADDVGGIWNPQLFSFKEGDTAPKKVGTRISSIVVGSGSQYMVALDNNDIPYIVSNQDKKLSYVAYNPETNGWDDLVEVSDTPVNTGYPVFLDFDSDNVGYIGAMASAGEYMLFKLTSVE